MTGAPPAATGATPNVGGFGVESVVEPEILPIARAHLAVPEQWLEERSDASHYAILVELARDYTPHGSADILESVFRATLNGAVPQAPFAVVGEAGTGKSTLAAYFARTCMQGRIPAASLHERAPDAPRAPTFALQTSPSPPAMVFYHHVGPIHFSVSIRNVIARLSAMLQRVSPTTSKRCAYHIADDMSTLARRLNSKLIAASKALAGRPIVVVIDGLDLCNVAKTSSFEQAISWIPSVLPPGVFFLLSIRESSPLFSEILSLSGLRIAPHERWTVLSLESLDVEDSARCLDTVFQTLVERETTSSLQRTGISELITAVRLSAGTSQGPSGAKAKGAGKDLYAAAATEHFEVPGLVCVSQDAAKSLLHKRDMRRVGYSRLLALSIRMTRPNLLQIDHSHISDQPETEVGLYGRILDHLEKTYPKQFIIVVLGALALCPHGILETDLAFVARTVMTVENQRWAPTMKSENFFSFFVLNFIYT